MLRGPLAQTNSVNLATLCRSLTQQFMEATHHGPQSAVQHWVAAGGLRALPGLGGLSTISTGLYHT